MPSFRQARGADSSLEADMMSTFALGQMLVRRSGYGAMQLAGRAPLGRHLTGHRLSACSGPRSPRESITSTRPSTTAPASSTI